MDGRLTYLDLVPPVPSGTSGDELSPSGSRRMCPTNRLLLVATMSCSANCPDRAITSSFVMWSRHEMSKMLLSRVFWVCTRVSEPWIIMISIRLVQQTSHFAHLFVLYGQWLWQGNQAKVRGQAPLVDPVPEKVGGQLTPWTPWLRGPWNRDTGLEEHHWLVNTTVVRMIVFFNFEKNKCMHTFKNSLLLL